MLTICLKHQLKSFQPYNYINLILKFSPEEDDDESDDEEDASSEDGEDDEDGDDGEEDSREEESEEESDEQLGDENEVDPADVGENLPLIEVSMSCYRQHNYVL